MNGQVDIGVGAKTKQIFVTVGSTKFPRLLAQIEQLWWDSEILNTKITIQYGDTDISSYVHNKPPNVNFISWVDDIRWELYDLVIGHCGVGTILDLIQAQERWGRRPCILFFCNDEVQDTHQNELLMKFVALEEEHIKMGCGNRPYSVPSESGISLKYLSTESNPQNWIKIITHTLNNPCDGYCSHLSGGQNILHQKLVKLGKIIGDKHRNG